MLFPRLRVVLVLRVLPFVPPPEETPGKPDPLLTLPTLPLRARFMMPPIMLPSDLRRPRP